MAPQIFFMALTREQKQKIITKLQDLLAEQKGIVFIDFSGVKAKEILNLRRGLKKQNCLLKVSKKTLLKIAFKNSKIPLWQKIDEAPGQLGIVFGFGDEITPTKITYEFSKKNENLKILAGIIKTQNSKLKTQNYKFLTAQEIIILAQLLSREELLAKFAGTISSPIFNFVNVLKGNIKGLIYIIKQAKTQ